jgi:hypothetical protein
VNQQGTNTGAIAKGFSLLKGMHISQQGRAIFSVWLLVLKQGELRWSLVQCWSVPQGNRLGAKV